jgi:RNA polymerase sigma-70 factor (ECF subfamily)
MNEPGDVHLPVFQSYRPLLFSLAYRMLGSVTDAEDILQDAFVRFQARRLDEIDAPKAYLSTIVTRLCLNQLSSARSRRETYLGPWLPEPILSEAQPGLIDPDAQASELDSISLAFLALLERLTPAERAVFLLREVFDYEYGEIATILDRSEAACRKLFSRAKAYLSSNRPRFEANAKEHRRLLEEFMWAVGAGDLEGLMGLLEEEATLWADGGGKVRGAALWPLSGRREVASFVIGVSARFMPAGAQFQVAEVNARPTLLIRHADGSPAIVVSIAAAGNRISHVWVIANPDKLGAVGGAPDRPD